jgi:hypothetical protein
MEQNEEEKHSTNNVNSPAFLANALSAADQTIKLSRDNSGKDKRCEDG